MKKTAFAIGTIIILCLTSCFQVVQHITIHKDGSGNARIILNLSESKTKVKELIESGNYLEYKIPSKQQIISRLDTMRMTLEATENIYNVKVQQDFNEYIFTLTFDFKDVNELDKNSKTGKQFLRYSNNQLEVIEPENFVLPEDAKKEPIILEKANFMTVIKLPDNTILETSNTNYNISPNKQAIMIRGTLNKFAEPNYFQTKIKLK